MTHDVKPCRHGSRLETPQAVHYNLQVSNARISGPFVLAIVCAPLLVIGACEKKTKPKLQSRETVGKTTQEVRNLKPELAQGGQVTDGKIHATDYLGVQADAYRTSVGNIAKMKVKMDMDMYEATNGQKPKTYDEFMELIIKKGKAEGIQLPMLPYYQEYAYDSDKKELVVVEYPAKKKAMQEHRVGKVFRVRDVARPSHGKTPLGKR